MKKPLYSIVLLSVSNLFIQFSFGQASTGLNPEYSFTKTQGVLEIGSSLGIIRFLGRGNTFTQPYVPGASMEAVVSGTLINGHLPTKLYFSTDEGQGLQRRFVITEGGLTGINNDDPQARLSIRHFSGSGVSLNNILKIEGGTENSPKLFQLSNNASNTSLNAILQGTMNLEIGDMNIKDGNMFVPSGRIAIGTDDIENDEYLLQVKGGIRGAKVQVLHVENWPDYVFSKDYSILSLKEIEKYINENHHLPEVPTAKEVSENGFDSAEMIVLLLKKIEELTLNAIEQQKEIEALQKSFLNLQKEN